MEACNDITVMVKFNGEHEQHEVQQLLFTRVPCVNEQIIVGNATYRVDTVTHLANRETAIIEVTKISQLKVKPAIKAFMEAS